MTERRTKQLRFLQILAGVVCGAVILSIWAYPNPEPSAFNAVRMGIFILVGFPGALAAFLLHADRRSGF